MATSYTQNTIISQKRTVTCLASASAYQNSHMPSVPKYFTLVSKLPQLSSSKLIICSAAKVSPLQVEEQATEDKDFITSTSTNGWEDFASKVSGEWDGFGADFTTEGKPIELPESVVPGAYREWDVQVFDWQTQCPTLAKPQSYCLSYRSVKLLPTVGCEADAATVYTTEEKVIKPEGSDILAFAYQNTGCYVALWPVEQTATYKVLELEHCLIDPRDKESRIRLIQKIRFEENKSRLLNIRVFCEQWYGPFRNGDQLGGCAIRDSAFASTAALKLSDVSGIWLSQNAVVQYQSSQNDTLQELIGARTQKVVRNEGDLIPLPRQLWCSLSEGGNGETFTEFGWLLDRGFALSSRCIFSSNGQLKEIAIGSDTADVN